MSVGNIVRHIVIRLDRTVLWQRYGSATHGISLARHTCPRRTKNAHSTSGPDRHAGKGVWGPGTKAKHLSVSGTIFNIISLLTIVKNISTYTRDKPRTSMSPTLFHTSLYHDNFVMTGIICSIDDSCRSPSCQVIQIDLDQRHPIEPTAPTTLALQVSTDPHKTARSCQSILSTSTIRFST